VNNAALAAKYLQDYRKPGPDGDVKVGILDIDFHHGNGTQDIIRHLENILLVSIHGHPDHSYPYLTGYASENTHKNLNIPLEPGTTDKDYFMAFQEAVKGIIQFGVRYLVISLGVDTYEKEVHGNFNLTSGIYPRLSEHLIRMLKIPVLIVMEGGYNKEFLAGNVIAFLEPFIGQGK
jgi:acetoin utilization deacetylase AcuC-like enzyme